MTTISNGIYLKNPEKFVCNLCYFTCSYNKDYERHISTQKHKKHILATEINGLATEKPIFTAEPLKYECLICDKHFKDRSGLWRHKKTCVIISNKDDLNNELKQQQLIEYLLKENAEFKQLMIDQNKQMIEQNKQMVQLAQNAGHNNSSNNNNNSNSNNNSFNLQFFLNEQCKNAMNIMDFVNQLQVSVNDLEETGRLGFAQGISNIFINGLKQIDVSDRPIHCSDSKRETLYIKNNDQWNKETEDKAVLTNAIKHVAHKNMKQISEWQKTHPEYNDSDSKQNDKYLKIVSESMSGSSKEESHKNYEKIARNIAKEVIIEK